MMRSEAGLGKHRRMLLLTTDRIPTIDPQPAVPDEIVGMAASSAAQGADEAPAKGSRKQGSLRPRTAAIKPSFYRNVVDRRLIRREKTRSRMARKQRVAQRESEAAGAVEEPARRRIRLRISRDEEELEIKSDVMAEDSGPHLPVHQACVKDKTSLEPLSMLRPVEGIINNDYCEVCRGDGFFICCEACPKSFHCSCIVPSIEPDKMPAESWFCTECRERATAAVTVLAKDAAVAPRPPRRSVKAAPGKRAVRAYFCHYCRKVDPRQPALQCTRCPLAWHPRCLSLSHSISSLSNTPFVCPAHVPPLASDSADSAVHLSPFVLAEHALRMVGIADDYPKHARVPDWICAYYDEIRLPTQSERCCVGIETDLY